LIGHAFVCICTRVGVVFRKCCGALRLVTLVAVESSGLRAVHEQYVRGS